MNGVTSLPSTNKIARMEEYTDHRNNLFQVLLPDQKKNSLS